jgi:hypothetical protein
MDEMDENMLRSSLATFSFLRHSHGAGCGEPEPEEVAEEGALSSRGSRDIRTHLCGSNAARSNRSRSSRLRTHVSCVGLSEGSNHWATTFAA